MEFENLLLKAVNASIEAGKAILEVYNSDFAVEHKEDKSPLTEADKQSNAVIEHFLSDTGLPLLSEEGKSIAYEDRKDWEYFWMIDPLDGTKEFIKRNGEFTVNIALMHKNYPVLGVVYVPEKNIVYLGDEKLGGFKIEDAQDSYLDLDAIKMVAKRLPEADNDRKYTVVGSRSHPSAETQEFIDELEKTKGNIDVISIGSSLKLCLVAEGKADAYPRFAPTMEWDTAAGQAVVEASGASVVQWPQKNRMSYNKENLLNEWFLVQRD